MDVTASERSGAMDGWGAVLAVIATGGMGIVAALVVIAFFLVGPGIRSATDAPVAIVATELETAVAWRDDGSRLPTGAPLTSRTFRPLVTFSVAAMGAGDRPEFCVWGASARAVELGHAMGCIDEVWIVRPFAVACGPRDDRPDARSLTAAMLARPGLGAVDLGPIEPGVTVPDGLFVDPPAGRVLEVVGSGPFGGDVADPDGCRLLPDPSSHDDVVEIRRDLTARFILFDVDGELIVIRAGFGGHDQASGAAGFERGYGRFDRATLDHMLESIRDLRFD